MDNGGNHQDISSVQGYQTETEQYLDYPGEQVLSSAYVVAYQWLQDNTFSQAIFKDVDTVFHLAGESVFKGRWNTDKKDRIMRSRVDGTRNLIN